MPVPTLLNADELAAHFGCCDQTIRTWAKAGKIPFVKDERGRKFFALPAVIAALRTKPERLKVKGGAV